MPGLPRQSNNHSDMLCQHHCNRGHWLPIDLIRFVNCQRVSSLLHIFFFFLEGGITEVHVPESGQQMTCNMHAAQTRWNSCHVQSHIPNFEHSTVSFFGVVDSTVWTLYESILSCNDDSPHSWREPVKYRIKFTTGRKRHIYIHVLQVVQVCILIVANRLLTCVWIFLTIPVVMGVYHRLLVSTGMVGMMHVSMNVPVGKKKKISGIHNHFIAFIQRHAVICTCSCRFKFTYCSIILYRFKTGPAVQSNKFRNLNLCNRNNNLCTR